MMSPELLQLAAQIAAAPDDSELQKIFADALIEEGGEHAIRGELIHRELAGKSDPQLAERLKQAREARGLELGSDGFARKWSCTINSVAILNMITIEQLATVAAAVFAEEPLLDWLDLRFIDPQVDGPRMMRELAAIPELARVRSLDLYGAQIGPGGIAALLASPHWPRLELLFLMSAGLGDAGATLLAGSSSMSELRHLSISTNTIGPDGAIALARSPVFGKLKTLTLAANPIGERGIDALASAAAMQLEVLDVRATGARRDQLDAIAARFPGIAIVSDYPREPVEEEGDTTFTKGPFV